MPATKLKEFLDQNNIRYKIILHSPAYTAHEIAASAQVPSKDLAKTLLIKVDDRMTMAVLPASHRADLDQLREALGAEHVELANEEEFRDAFPGCALGAMPPFGNLYDLEVVVARRLTEDKEIAFNAGTHTELVKLDYEDFDRLVHPKVLTFT
jgi:Ala-tRNA(Pro) deacylase